MAEEKEESLFQKESRLKKRKQDWKMSYKKGVYFQTWNYKELIEWIEQKDVIIKVHSAGNMDDGTEFMQITIEGFKPKEK